MYQRNYMMQEASRRTAGHACYSQQSSRPVAVALDTRTLTPLSNPIIITLILSLISLINLLLVLSLLGL